MLQMARSVAVLLLLIASAALLGVLTFEVLQLGPNVANDVVKFGDALDSTKTAADQLAATSAAAQSLIDENRPAIAATTKDLTKAIAGIDKAIDEVNRPCGAHGSCGTIADVNRTLATIRGTAGQIEIAARHENQRLGVLDGQEQQLADDTHQAIGKLIGAIDSVQQLAANKDLAGSFASANKTLTAVAAIATDTQQAVHNWLHPKWPARIYGEVKSWAGSIAKAFIP